MKRLMVYISTVVSTLVLISNVNSHKCSNFTRLFATLDTPHLQAAQLVKRQKNREYGGDRRTERDIRVARGIDGDR